MPTLKNTIIIDAAIEKIWHALSQVDQLAVYDPSCERSVSITKENAGIGAKRRVDMTDGKNWFEEKCTVYEEHQDLKYELTSCSFPVLNLNHQYSFRKLSDAKYEVTQVQNYKMKHGILGSIMAIMIKAKWNKGVRAFLGGLKQHAENH
ncbi:MAG: SRPBCC family protein [Bacteroidota bacterium]